MRTILFALVLAAAASLAACGLEDAIGDDSAGWGTVVSVQDAERGEAPEALAKYDDHPLVPELGWEIVVQLDDGAAVTVMHGGTRHYKPGERVLLLKGDDGELLL